MMQRNEKGQFVKENENVSVDDQIKEVENRLAELKKVKAEKVEAEKRAAALARKAEAEPVNAAIDKYEEAKSVCNEKIKAAFEEYKSKVAEAERELKVFEADADEKLNKYLESHGHFHYTYKSDDGHIVRNYDYRNKAYDVFDNYNHFVNAINRLWMF